MKRIAIFASGQGSNAANLIRYFKEHPVARVTWVASNRKQAPVLELAADLGVETTFFESTAWENGTVLRELQDRKIDIIVLAGFLKLVPAAIIKAYPNRIINIHPALLPKFGGKGMYGLHVHNAVVAAGEKETGITIHYVNEHFDEGEIIAQYKIPLSPHDNPDAVQAHVRNLELKWLPIVIGNLVESV
jgi:phosphoribosylglycinamide formyltransferase-1